MKSETRRGIRSIVSILHIALQAALVYMLVAFIGTEEVVDTNDALGNLHAVVVQVGVIIAVYTIYRSGIQLLTAHNRNYRN